MRNLGWNRHVEAMADRDRHSDVTPPPSAVAARIAKRIGESVGRDAADDVVRPVAANCSTIAPKLAMREP